MPYFVYHIIHLFFLFIFIALTFTAFANPTPEKKKFVMAGTGIAMLLVFVAGFGLIARTGLGFPPWIIAKLVIWFVLAGLPAMAFKRPHLIPKLKIVTPILMLVAICLVSLKP